MRQTKGFTIVELMLYMALMATVLVILTEVFLSVLSVQTESGTVSNVEVDGRFILARLFYDVNRADSIALPSNLGETASSAQLVTNGVTYTYGTGANEELTISSNGETDNLTGPDTRISDLTFTRLGNVGGKNSLQVKFRLTSGKESRNYQTTVSQR